MSKFVYDQAADSISLDGKQLSGVRSFSVSASAGETMLLTLEVVIAAVEVNLFDKTVPRYVFTGLEYMSQQQLKSLQATCSMLIND